MSDIHIVIPARYQSSRLPGKPLRLINNVPMIEHVYRRAQESGVGDILVATDDRRIVDKVLEFGGNVALTQQHDSGTDRLVEVCRLSGWRSDDIVVNLQGDEPLIPPALIRVVARSLATNGKAGISTLACPINSIEDALDPNQVKVVLNNAGMALYFSRAPIPWNRAKFPGLDSNLSKGYLRHIGIYAYRVSTLLAFSEMEPCFLEQLESLEQLRALFNGVRIHVTKIEHAPAHGVDTEQDLQRVCELMA